MPKEIYRSPWFDLLGYLACTVRYANGNRGTVLQHREVMENYIGRRLEALEHVHHINGDRRDNRLKNLEVIAAEEHARLHHVDPEWVDFICLECGLPSTKLARKVRSNRKQGKTGPFCGRRCAGKWSKDRQVNQPRPKILLRHGIERKYRKGCRCCFCRAAHAAHARKYRKSRARVK